MLILFLCGIILVPLVVGTAVTPRLYEDRIVQLFLNYLTGFSVILCVFTLFFYYFLASEGSFWILSTCFAPALLFITVFSLIRLYFMRGHFKWNKKQADKGSGTGKGGSIVLYLALALILFELLRGFLMKSFSYRDDRSYIPLVNDILHTGILNGKQYLSGAYYTGMPYYLQGGYKLALSSWYAFEAWMAQLSGLHPLILCNRVFPILFPAYYYMTRWILGCTLFQDKGKRYWFLFFTVLLNLIWNVPPQQQILLLWPSWGKNVTATVYVPMTLILHYQYGLQRGKTRVVLVLLLMVMDFAGCATSAMGALILPLETGILSVILLVRKRQFRIVPESVVMVLPAAALMLAYFRYFT